jgi:hypothetical protein
MANLLATDYHSLVSLFANRAERVIGNNTKAFIDREDGTIVVTLHDHPIVELTADGTISVSLAGWPTVTTRERVNQFLPPTLGIFQRNHEQKISLRIDGTTVVRPFPESGWVTVASREHGQEHAFVASK